MSTAKPQRRADIDWIRIAAFGVLILYHVGLVYAPWDWHVHSPHTVQGLGLAALVTNPWRLTLLFMVSGIALRYLTDAVFPCYLAHQTLLVIAAHLLIPLGLPVGVEAGLLVLITLGGSLAVYEIVRRSGPLRPLWGLRPRPRTP